ncbi:C2HC-type zinc finger protein NDAI_0D01170 [Naumovozyma dairenensis CBS 421]|uniref:CCHC-type domain-containing protein n=1 Tax=Naumovozyma dairenensis (strain ATCC 10597 / BCRC 20456 / CBS 421 / NBRC 0211 / NRRL Y-12639) TaxID=1071378 RepID=G0W9G9_NAUDC|nr:hypothetical protein NDAI_0D01170 [Naumovozyma dairenensis CBS 421]CCD24430.1 hypothetical protein NDAI_0D01170 [Naumovozyma dairenensis CBS 421]
MAAITQKQDASTAKNGETYSKTSVTNDTDGNISMDDGTDTAAATVGGEEHVGSKVITRSVNSTIEPSTTTTSSVSQDVMVSLHNPALQTLMQSLIKTAIEGAKSQTQLAETSLSSKLHKAASTVAKFDGKNFYDPEKDWVEWVARLRNVAMDIDPKGLDDATMLDLARRTLVDRALELFLRHKDELKSLDDFKKVMMSASTNSPYWKSAKAITSIRFGGDVEDYNRRFNRLKSSLPANFYSPEVLDPFFYLMGLGETNAAQLLGEIGDLSKTLDECQQIATNLSFKLKRESSDDSFHARVGKKRKINPLANRITPNMTAKSRCYRCNETGHFAAKCPSKSKN